MLSQTNTFRAAVRHAPRLASTSAASLGVGSSRLFSSTAAVRETDPTKQAIYDTLDRAQERLGKTYAAPPISSIHASTIQSMHPSFIYPKDFDMKTRMPSDAVPRKPMALGPRRADAKRLDIFHQYQIDPVKEAMNSLIMSAYVSDMGKIKNRAESQLTWKSQRRMGKAIRRAKNMGIIPLLSRRSLKSAQDQ